MLIDSLRAVPYPRRLAGLLEEHEIKRAVFQVSLLTDRLAPPFSLIDLGAGIGIFAIACSESGINVVAVDKYAEVLDDFHSDDEPLSVLRSYGVKLLDQDVLAETLPFPDNSIDAICSFFSMEHFHHSPKSLFAQCVRILRPGGVFVLATPNCVNLRKRITVPFGYGKWSQMEHWYEWTRFRGHVREPDVADLRYIAKDMGLRDVRIVGRNWIGMSRKGMVGNVSRLVDPVLGFFPSLCSDIYMTGLEP